MTHVAVQTRLDLIALEAGIACFGTRAPTHAVALLDVVGAEAALASADDATQEEMLAGRAQFLNAQTIPFQVLLRAEPVDLASHVARIRARAEQRWDSSRSCWPGSFARGASGTPAARGGRVGSTRGKRVREIRKYDEIG